MSHTPTPEQCKAVFEGLTRQLIVQTLGAIVISQKPVEEYAKVGRDHTVQMCIQVLMDTQEVVVQALTALGVSVQLVPISDLQASNDTTVH